MKRIILNADNFGACNDANRAILNGSNNGFLKSTSIIANGLAYNTAINEILPECPKLSCGINLNIINGHALTNCSYLTNDKNSFKNTFFKVAKFSKNKKVLCEIEKEFRAQISSVSKYIKITHIDSVDSIHCIPEIFDMVCKLAVEFCIPYIIIHNEKFVFVPKFKYILNPRLVTNFIKCLIYNLYSSSNKKILKKYNLKSNTYSIGTLYFGMTDEYILEQELALIDDNKAVVHVKLSPASYLRHVNNTYSKEYNIIQNKLFEDNIKRLGFDITNYR